MILTSAFPEPEVLTDLGCLLRRQLNVEVASLEALQHRLCHMFPKTKWQVLWPGGLLTKALATMRCVVRSFFLFLSVALDVLYLLHFWTYLSYRQFFTLTWICYELPGFGGTSYATVFVIYGY